MCNEFSRKLDLDLLVVGLQQAAIPARELIGPVAAGTLSVERVGQDRYPL